MAVDEGGCWRLITGLEFVGWLQRLEGSVFGCHSLLPVSTRLIQDTPGNESLICLGGKRGSNQEASIISPQSFWGTNHLNLKVALSARCHVSLNNRTDSQIYITEVQPLDDYDIWSWWCHCLALVLQSYVPLTCVAMSASGFRVLQRGHPKFPPKGKVIQARNQNHNANPTTVIQGTRNNRQL